MLGIWEVQARWVGDTYHHSTSSLIRTFAVTLSPTEITCTTDATSIIVGTSILLEGSLTPSMATPISILYSTDTTWRTLADLTTLSDGNYQYSWTPTTAETHRFKAVYAGDDTYGSSESAVLTISLAKTASSITCNCPSTVGEGKTVTVTGEVDPPINERTVTLTYQQPSGETVTRTVTTDTRGEYTDTYSPSATGTWRVTASWEGDDTYESATSSVMSFTVEKSGCLIATATFGSELTPQVQFLRNFRDHRVLQTFAGSQFMIVFNCFTIRGVQTSRIPYALMTVSPLR